MLIFSTKYADVFLIRRYTLVINYLQEAVYRRKEKYKLDILQSSISCEVSLENMMACGIGACLCCVENTTEGHLCVCKEGPVFNINKLLWQI